MRKILLTAMAALSCLSISALADQHTSSEAHKKAEKAWTKLKTDCEGDVKKFCSDVTPGEGRVASCLDSKSDQLSDTCKKTWSQTNAKISEKMDKANVSFRKNCGSDVQKFCADVPSGRGRLINCLNEHEDALSNSCKNLQAKVRNQISDILG